MIKSPAPGLDFEQELWRSGLKFIGGIDEAGRGALAGPVAAGAVILPDSPQIADLLRDVRDSKLLNAIQREKAAQDIKNHAIGWGVGFASVAEINETGILPATRKAVWRAIQNLPVLPQYLLMDYIHWPGLNHPHLTIPKGESLSLSIAAASVLAKTARDALLRELDGSYPGYGFAKHKGYGTAAHCAAITKMGPTEIHRILFIRNVMSKNSR
jgi:ribonuclease HII